MLKWGQTRNHGYDHIAESLGKFAGSSHYPGQVICGLDHALDDRQAFAAVAVQQLLVPAPLQKEIKLPGEIPNIVQPGIHPLAAEWTMNVSSVTGYEYVTFAQPRHLAVMNAEVAAPVQSSSLNCAGGALSQYPAYEIERGRVAFWIVDGSDDAAARGAH